MKKTRILYTLNELKEHGLLPITSMSYVIDPNNWYFTKYPDGMYWPYDTIERLDEEMKNQKPFEGDQGATMGTSY